MEDIKKKRLEEAIRFIKAGRAICFVGAGFSLSGKDCQGRSILSSSALRRELRKLAGLPENDESPLEALGDYMAGSKELAPQLRSLIIDRFTVCQPSDEQKEIAALPWRAVFTTNYDDLFERADQKHLYQSISAAPASFGWDRTKRPIVHLHGRASDLLNSDLSAEIVLSQQSYIKLQQQDRDLFAALENEVHNASRVFFIGYSIADLKIAETVLRVNSIRRRAILINSPIQNPVERARLAKFGELFEIGLGGLIESIKNDVDSCIKLPPTETARYLELIEPSVSQTVPRRGDVEALLLSGEFNHAQYLRQIEESGDEQRYCVDRSVTLEKIQNAFSKERNRFLVTSELGNGKSIFLNQLATRLARSGIKTYIVRSTVDGIFEEIDRAFQQTGTKAFIIDDFMRYRRIIEYIGARLSAEALVAVGASQSDLDFEV